MASHYTTIAARCFTNWTNRVPLWYVVSMAAQQLSAEQLRQDLRALRQAGFSSTDLCRTLGVGRTSLWRWETGVCMPNPLKCLQVHMYVEQRGPLSALEEDARLIECLYALTAAGVTQRQICEAVGISRSTLYNWYRRGVSSGQHGHALVALANLHGIDVSQLEPSRSSVLGILENV